MHIGTTIGTLIAAAIDMTTFTLTGTGVQAISSPGSVAVAVTVLPSFPQLGNANPQNYYHLGQLRFGNSHGYLPPIPLDAVSQLIPLATGMTLLGYKLDPAVTITVEERAEVPYAGPTGPPGAAGAAGAAGPAGSPGAQLIASVTVTSPVATLDFSSIPATYTHLQLWFSGLRTSSASSKQVQLLLNGDTAAHYSNGDMFVGPSSSQLSGNSSQAAALQIATAPATSATTFDCSGVIEIPNYLRTTGHTFTCRASDTSSIGFGVPTAAFHGYWWAVAAAINRLTLQLIGANNFDQGKAWLYGV